MQGRVFLGVTPAKAGVQSGKKAWIPACAGMTQKTEFRITGAGFKPVLYFPTMECALTLALSRREREPEKGNPQRGWCVVTLFLALARLRERVGVRVPGGPFRANFPGRASEIGQSFDNAVKWI